DSRPRLPQHRRHRAGADRHGDVAARARPQAGAGGAQGDRGMTLSDNDELLLNAYLDGELGAEEAAGFKRRLAGRPSPFAALEARRLLREGMRSGLDDDVPPRDLEDRIMTRIAPPKPAAVRSTAWRSLAASLLVGTIFGSALTLGLLNQHGNDEFAS